MFFAIKHSLLTLHTIRVGSKLESGISKKTFEKSITLKINGEKYTVFRNAEEARIFHDLAMLTSGDGAA